MPAENLNTEDAVEATVTNTPAMPTEGLSEDDYCDICRARMTPQKQLTLNEVTHNVLVCTADPKHTKTVLA